MDSSMAGEGAVKGIFGSFNRTFWVVNAFELFERGAYYATMAILTVYVVEFILEDRPNASSIFGVLYGFVIILLYFYPVISGALAEKYGYKNMLLFAFVALIAGYILMSMAGRGQLAFFALAYALVGLGAGTFKPIVSATIAHVTGVDQRNQAYSIYYWLINFGAFSSNLLLGFALSQMSLFKYIFVVSAFLICINLGILLLFFRNPVEPRKELSIAQAIRRIAPAFRDRKFVVLLLIYSGFWFMYTFQTFIQLYMIDFGRMPRWFAIQWLATINPGTIIALGPILGKAIAKFNSLSVMMAGISIACLGIAIIGFSGTSVLFFAGIVVFSIGEFITHPGFIAYVSKIAPTDKLAIYMASIFVSVGIGQITGGVAQGFFYDILVREMLRPKLYISLIIVVGLLTLLFFMLYTKWLMKDTTKVEPSLLKGSGFWTRSTTMLVALILIPATGGLGLAAGTTQLAPSSDEPTGVDWTEYASASKTIDDVTGTSQEGETDEELVQIDVPNVVKLTFTLTWTDEADAGVRYNNEPDQFRLTVTPPNGSAKSAGPTGNAQGGAGTVIVTIDYALGDRAPFFNGTGQWAIEVELVTAGDQVLWRPGIGLFDRADTSNAWALTGECEYMERAS